MTWRIFTGLTREGGTPSDAGTLWTWGANSGGQLGNGTVASSSSPVKVGTLTDWAKVTAGYYHAAAIKTDGTLWTFVLTPLAPYYPWITREPWYRDVTVFPKDPVHGHAPAVEKIRGLL